MEDASPQQEQVVIPSNDLSITTSKKKHTALAIILLVILFISIAIPGGIFLFQKKIKKLVRYISATPTPTRTPLKMNMTHGMSEQKIYTNAAFGLSFSYPSNFSYLDLGGSDHIYIHFFDTSKQLILRVHDIDLNNLCTNGGTILTGEPHPTSLVNIAEDAASCLCIAGSSQNGSVCSLASDEKPFTVAKNTIKDAFQFFLQEDLYKNGTLITSKKRGPYTAFFFPKATNTDTKNILGFYIESTNNDSLSIYNALISTVTLSSQASSSANLPQGITADENNNTGTITLQKGTLLKIVLHSLYWNFDTQTNNTILKQINNPVYTPISPAPAPGTGVGTVTATYQALMPGQTTISASRQSCGEALRCAPDQENFLLHITVN